MSLPRTPVITSRRIGKTKATQTMFLIEKGQIAYLVSMIQMEKGTGPKNPDLAYFQNLVKNYTEGSKTRLRTSSAAKVARLPGIEGISDVKDSAHVVQLTASATGSSCWSMPASRGRRKAPTRCASWRRSRS